MKIAICVLDASTGGHTRTAVSTARCLATSGHEVLLVADEEGASPLIVRSGLPYQFLKVSPSGRIPGLRSALETRLGTVDVVHAFSMVAFPWCALTARQLRAKSVLTICGGPPPRRYPVMGGMSVLSQEQADGLARQGRLTSEDLLVVPGRLDLASIDERLDQGRRMSESAAAACQPTRSEESALILRVARVHPHYLRSIIEGAEAVAKLASEGKRVRFVHVGKVLPDRQYLADALREHFTSINDRFADDVVESIQEADPPIHELLAKAAIVIGTGRTAFEAMLSRLPVIVVGPKGFAGVVSPETIPTHLYYNFSGRNGEVQTPDASVSRLAAAIDGLLRAPQDEQQLAQLDCWVREQLQVELGAKAYVDLYNRLRPGDAPSVGQLSVMAALQLVNNTGRYVRGRLPPRWQSQLRMALERFS